MLAWASRGIGVRLGHGMEHCTFTERVLLVGKQVFRCKVLQFKVDPSDLDSD